MEDNKVEDYEKAKQSIFQIIRGIDVLIADPDSAKIFIPTISFVTSALMSYLVSLTHDIPITKELENGIENLMYETEKKS